MTRATALAEDPAARPCGLTAVVAGDGPEVVLVHGALGDYRQWNAIVSRLQPAHTVVAVSRRGHWPDLTPCGATGYSYEGHRDDLLCYLGARGKAVHLVGHSWGAGIALLAALRDSARLRTLTLIEPAFASLLPADAPSLAAENTSRTSMLASVQSLVGRGDNDAAGREMIDWTQGGTGGFSRLPADAQHVLLQNAATVGPTFSRAAPAVTPDDVSRLQVPTLLVRGERTRLYYRLILETLLTSIRHAESAVIAAAGHMSIVEEPYETAGALLSFFSRH